jgi:hypothetical protein
MATVVPTRLAVNDPASARVAVIGRSSGWRRGATNSNAFV